MACDGITLADLRAATCGCSTAWRIEGGRAVRRENGRATGRVTYRPRGRNGNAPADYHVEAQGLLTHAPTLGAALKRAGGG